MSITEPGRADENDDEKLIPEWGVSGDDQIVWAGVLVTAALLLLAGWSLFFGGDEAPEVAAVVEETVDAVDETGDLLGGAAAAPAIVGVNGDSDTDPGAEPRVEIAPDSDDEMEADAATTAVEPVGVDEPALNAAVAAAAGSVAAGIDGNSVTLTGFVANEAEESSMVDSARIVDGVESVVNELELLEPAVTNTLTGEGVVDAAASGVGTRITVQGVLQSEDQRPDVLAAAAAVPGVSEVVDDLTVSVAADLNELPTVPFATSSDEILFGGNAIITEAADLIIAAGDVELEVQGFTDTRGSAADNLALSEARAAAVAIALIEAGVDSQSLTVQGYGETDRFDAGDTPEAYAANRVVRFEEVG